MKRRPAARGAASRKRSAIILRTGSFGEGNDAVWRRRASTLISRNWKTEKAKGLSAGALSDLGGPRVALSARRESATEMSADAPRF